MDAIEVDGALLHVAETGNGPTALVLHGGLGLDHTMYRTLDPLGERLRLVFVDHRGNGRSTGDLATATMDRWAADVVAVAEAVAPGERVIVIGHSYGGFIAQEAMISYPDRIRATVLLATTPGQLGDGEEPSQDGPPMPDEVAALLAAVPGTDEEFADLMFRLAPAYLHRAPVDELRSAMARTEFRSPAMARGVQVLSTWSSVDRLASVAMPVLVVAGRHDVFAAWPQSDRIARRLPDADTIVLEQSGHFPWIDEPEVFFPAVTGWMERRGLLGR